METLKIAARQGDVEILISVGGSTKVQTKSIKGRYAVQEALDLMLEGTPLVAVPVSGGKAFGILHREKKGGYASNRAENQLRKILTTETQSEMNLNKQNNRSNRKNIFKPSGDRCSIRARFSVHG